MGAEGGYPMRLMRRATTVALMALLATILVTVGGSAATAGAAPGDLPVGGLETATPLPGAVRLTGWALDGNDTSPLDIHVYADGQFLGLGRADETRGDIAARYPWAGADHGFDLTLALSPGRHVVCAFAINLGLGDQNPQLGCIVVANDVPFGWLDVAERVPEGIHLKGWSIDPAAPSSSPDVYVEVGWGFAGTIPTGVPNAGVAATYPVGGNHGFDAIVPVPSRDGATPVCVYGYRGGATSVIGCAEIGVQTSPVGSLDGVRTGTGDVRISGWAFDPDQRGPVEVQFHAEDGTVFGVLASGSRPDVAASYPAYGDAHGFALEIPARFAGQSVCAIAINVGPGASNLDLGCKRSGNFIPASSGVGRRIVYDNIGQHVWLVAADGYADRDYQVSGRYRDPGPGNYMVYAFQRYADAGHDGITMDYFVAFHPAGVGYGFHTIPVFADGTPLQDESKLGSFQSAGCVRQAIPDAIFLWNWAQIGDTVVVI